jgi:hypothetical protein
LLLVYSFCQLKQSVPKIGISKAVKKRSILIMKSSSSQKVHLRLIIHAFYALIMIFIFSAATCQKKPSTKSIQSANPSKWFDTGHRTDTLGTRVLYVFFIKNNTSKPITLYHPYELLIFPEAKEIPLPIRDCYCDAPCARRANELTLEPGQVHELAWDGMQTTCAPLENNSGLTTIRSQTMPGNYKLIWLVTLPDSRDHEPVNYLFRL